MNSLFKRHFAITAGMILLSFALLASAFMTLSYQFTVRNQRANLERKAIYMSGLTAQLFERDLAPDNEVFLRYLEGTAYLTDCDVLFCQPDGTVCFASEQDTLKTEWLGKTIPSSVIATLRTHSRFDSLTTLGIFPENRFVSGCIVTTGEGGLHINHGYILVSASTEALTQMWRSFSTIFFFTAVIVLVIAFVSCSISSMQQTKPLHEMTEAVRQIGMGEYSTRVQCADRKDEYGELARAFNSMADSIACAEQKRSEFVANISHELKTPMTTIAGFADGILDGTIPPEREKEYLQTISDETRRLARLVRRMLDMSNLQTQDNLVMSQTEFDIVEIMAQVLISLEGKIVSHTLDVDARLPDTPVYVWGDPDSITQVCYNLMDNAIKFAHPKTALGISITTRSGKAYISIRDIGETIPEEELPLIFDRLHKSDRSRSLDKDGVGLGLYLVKTILNQLKETITVTSKDNVTEFVFTLTLAR